MGTPPGDHPPRLTPMPDQTTEGRSVLGLDADDTLWENEARFAAAEH